MTDRVAGRHRPPGPAGGRPPAGRPAGRRHPARRRGPDDWPPTGRLWTRSPPPLATRCWSPRSTVSSWACASSSPSATSRSEVAAAPRSSPCTSTSGLRSSGIGGTLLEAAVERAGRGRLLPGAADQQQEPGSRPPLLRAARVRGQPRGFKRYLADEPGSAVAQASTPWLPRPRRSTTQRPCRTSSAPSGRSSATRAPLM